MTGLVFVRASQPGRDVATEARSSFETIRTSLEGQGLSLSDILKTRLHYASREVWADLNAVREPLYRATFLDRGFPASTGLITGGRAGGPRLEIEVVAARGKSTMNVDNVARIFGGRTTSFSHLGEAHGVAFLTGQSAFDDAGGFEVSSFGDEARKTLASLDEVLRASGRTAADIISLGTFLAPRAASVSAYDEIMGEVSSYLSQPYRPTVVVSVGVQDLVWEEMSIEIEATAGPAGAPRRAASGVPAASSLGRLPPHVSAVSAGGVVAAATTATDLLTALRTLASTVADVGGVSGSPLITVWYGGSLPEGAEKLIRQRVPNAVVSLAPMVIPSGAAAVTLELVGNSAP